MVGVVDAVGGGVKNVQPGDRVAQLMVVPVLCPALRVTDELPETRRGQGGVGSTGR